MQKDTYYYLGSNRLHSSAFSITRLKVSKNDIKFLMKSDALVIM